MLRYLPVVLELTAAVLISAAAYLVALPLGLTVSGISLALVGLGLERLFRKGTQ